MGYIEVGRSILCVVVYADETEFVRSQPVKLSHAELVLL